MTRTPDVGIDRLFATGGAMGQLMAGTDWSATPVGPPETWPPALRNALGTCLTSRFPMTVVWGPERIQFYNDGRIPILGDKHPAALGRPVAETWPEAWSTIGPLIDATFAGEPHYLGDTRFMLERHGYREETYFAFSYSPIRDEQGSVVGVFSTFNETTEQVINQRRLDALHSLSINRPGVRTVEDACRFITDALDKHRLDLPFAMIYLLDEDGHTVRLATTSAARPGTRLSPAVTTLDVGDFGSPMRAAARSGQPVEVPLPADAVAELAGWESGPADWESGPADWESGPAGWESGLADPETEPPNQAVVLPLPRAGGSRLAGFLIAGVNPHRALDDQYWGFLELVAARSAARIADAEAYEAEYRRAEALSALDRVKTEFFANVSHEFRTPLTLLLGPLEDLLADPTSVQPEARGLLEAAHRNALRLLKLVNTLLDFSQLEAGRAQAMYEPIDLAEHTAELVSAFRAATDRAGLKLEVDCAPLPEPVYVDPDMWDKIVFNLVSNALKFTPEGEIAVSVAADDDHALLVVRDTGIGIAASELPRLFDRFHRAADGRARTHEGTGIGLSLVRDLAVLHGGAVEVTSEPGVGTTFTVCVPFGTAHLPTDRLADRAEATVPDSTRLGAEPFIAEALRWLPDDPRYSDVTAPPRVDGRPEVLVVDDNADMREYLRRILSPHWQVRTAPDGAAALERIRRRLPDLVLTDVMMPVLDGFELIRRLRADEATRELPVIIVSARAGQDSTVDGLAIGANDYLIKPFTARELLARVRGQIEAARVRREYTDQLRRIIDAGVALTETVPTGETGRVLAELLIADAADWCAIWLLHPDLAGQERIALHLAAAAVPELSVALHDEPDLIKLLDVEYVIAYGRRATANSTGDWSDSLRMLTRDTTVVTLPLTARGITFGAVTVAVSWRDTERLPFLEEIVRRGAMVMDNARLFQAERRAAVSLQRSLLPRSLPAIPGAALAARYLPGAQGAEAGGDWYDVISLPGGRYGLTVGDVMGRGMQAAALMGQVRSALRSYALEGMPPARLLGRLDTFLAALDSPQLTTCLYATYQPDTRRLRIATAGHPPPLLINNDGQSEYLPVRPGLPLGLDVGAIGATETEITLDPGTRLLMFTDGLTERNDRPVGVGLQQLRQSFAAVRAGTRMAEVASAAREVSAAGEVSVAAGEVIVAGGTIGMAGGTIGMATTAAEACEQVCDHALAALGHTVDEGVASGHDDIALLVMGLDR